MNKEKKSFYVTPSVMVFEVNTVMPLAASNVEDSGGTGVSGRTDGGTVDSRYSDDDWDEDE